MAVNGARYSVVTPFAPANAPGAIAIVQLCADSANALDAALGAMGLAELPIGAMRVRRLLKVDQGVVVRWSERCVHLMPHAGRAVMRAMIEALHRAGIVPEPDTDDPCARFPESSDRIDACLCDALWRAQSPRAIEVLALHADRWRARTGQVLPDGSPHAQQLARLIDPPIVVGWGSANVGKSSLLNALARRNVSIVADRPGTTRDHVGVTLELDGLSVRWIDAPGLDAPGTREDHAAMELARVLATSAALIVLLGDAGTGLPEPPAGYIGAVLACSTRDDLGVLADSEVRTSVREGRGLDELAAVVRARLLPDAALQTPGRWRFSPALP